MRSNQQIAQTILQQLGSGRFKAMTGAKYLIAVENGLQFSLPLGKARINKVVIKVNGNDLYDVEFLHVKKDFTFTVKSCSTDIPWDKLREVFTEATGLATNL